MITAGDKPITDAQARIYDLIRRSPTKLTQAEIAKRLDASAAEVAKDCYALGAAGQITYSGGTYSAKRRAGR